MFWGFWHLYLLPIQWIYNFIQTSRNWKKVMIQTYNCDPLFMSCLKIFFLSKTGKLKGQNPDQFLEDSISKVKTFSLSSKISEEPNKVIHESYIIIKNLSLVKIVDSKDHLLIASHHAPGGLQRFERQEEASSTRFSTFHFFPHFGESCNRGFSSQLIRKL